MIIYSPFHIFFLLGPNTSLWISFKHQLSLCSSRSDYLTTGRICIRQYWGTFAQPLLLRAITVRYFERVSVFLPQLSGMQIACFWHPIKSSVACLTLPYFSALSHKRQDFRGEDTDHKMFLFSQQLVSKFLILRRLQWDILYIGLHYSCQMLMKLEFFRQIF